MATSRTTWFWSFLALVLVVGLAVVFVKAPDPSVTLDEKSAGLNDGIKSPSSNPPKGNRLQQPSTADVDSKDGDPTVVDSNLGWRLSLGEKARFNVPVPPPASPAKSMLASTPIGSSAIDDYQISKALRLCQRSPRTPEQLEDARLKLLSSRSPDTVTVLDDTGPEEQLLNATFALCNGLTNEDLQLADARLLSAAEQGLASAQLDYANLMLDRATLESTKEEISLYLGFLTKAKEQGNADAFFWSGLYGLRGLGDTTKATAVAELIVAEGVYREFGLRPNTARLIDAEFNLLFPEAREAAIAEARRIAADQNCCSVTYGKSWEEKLSEK